MNTSVKIEKVLSSEHYKVIRISGEKGDTLEKHKVNENAILLVKNGSITYEEENLKLVVSEGNGHSIPPEVYHKVSCNENAEIFLLLPNNGKMKFE